MNDFSKKDEATQRAAILAALKAANITDIEVHFVTDWPLIRRFQPKWMDAQKFRQEIAPHMEPLGYVYINAEITRWLGKPCTQLLFQPLTPRMLETYPSEGSTPPTSLPACTPAPVAKTVLQARRAAAYRVIIATVEDALKHGELCGFDAAVLEDSDEDQAITDEVKRILQRMEEQKTR